MIPQSRRRRLDVRPASRCRLAGRAQRGHESVFLRELTLLVTFQVRALGCHPHFAWVTLKRKRDGGMQELGFDTVILAVAASLGLASPARDTYSPTSDELAQDWHVANVAEDNGGPFVRMTRRVEPMS